MRPKESWRGRESPGGRNALGETQAPLPCDRRIGAGVKKTNVRFCMQETPRGGIEGWLCEIRDDLLRIRGPIRTVVRWTPLIR